MQPFFGEPFSDFPFSPFFIKDANTRHDFIGSCQTTIREMTIMKEMPLKNPKRKAISKIAGQLNVIKLEQISGAASSQPTMVGGHPGY